ncbi:MAG: helix-turn-helix transcriptional regulator [Fimbriimonadaceae bacterium]|nr:helix-turn-helix transcriptional regulator [Fimbriimonadaceae bacterium]
MDSELFPGQVVLADMNLDQLACLASAARVEVFWNVSDTIPRSIAEIAAMIGKSASGTTYHIIELVRVGLVIPAGERKKRSRTETLYVLGSRKGFLTKVAGGTEEFRKRALEGYAGLLRLMLRERTELTKAYGTDPTLQRFASARRWTIKLSPERAEAFREKMVAQFRELAYSEPDEDGRMVALSFIMTPTLVETRKINKEAQKRKKTKSTNKSSKK